MKLFEKEYLCNQNNAKSKDAAKRNRSPNLSNEFETIEAPEISSKRSDLENKKT
jgi:hypothetical protein